MPFTVYVIKNQKGQLYKGYTADLDNRLQEHNSVGEKHWTSQRGPWQLVHRETYVTKKEALDREHFLKSGKGRSYIKSILSGL